MAFALTTLSTIGFSPCLTGESRFAILSIYVGLLILITLFWIIPRLSYPVQFNGLCAVPQTLCENRRTWFRSVVLVCLLFLFSLANILIKAFCHTSCTPRAG